MVDSLKDYLRTGGRLIDTAPGYMSETEVGTAVRTSGVPREEIWVSSKIEPMSPAGFASLKGSIKDWAHAQVNETLRRMKLSYIDSMVLHYGPAQSQLQGTDGERKLGLPEYVEMWRGLMEAKQAGKVRNIGVCESTRSEIEHLIKATGETPAIALVWLSPFMPPEQFAVIKWMKGMGIAVQAYGLFNHKYMPGANSTVGAATAAAQRHGVTWGQLLLQWALDKGVALSTGMYHPHYLAEDTPCLDFHTDAQDEQLLAAPPRWSCQTSIENANQVLSGCAP